jgi:hypothetical protein
MQNLQATPVPPVPPVPVTLPTPSPTPPSPYGGGGGGGVAAPSAPLVDTYIYADEDGVLYATDDPEEVATGGNLVAGLKLSTAGAAVTVETPQVAAMVATPRVIVRLKRN